MPEERFVLDGPTARRSIKEAKAKAKEEAMQEIAIERALEAEERKKFLPAGHIDKGFEKNVYDLNPTREEFETFLFGGFKDKEDYLSRSSEEMRIRDYLTLLWNRGRRDEAQSLLEKQNDTFIMNYFPEGLNNLSGEPLDDRY